jgi:subtilisin family serine protease
MQEREIARGDGCRHRLTVIALLFWFGLAPVGATLLVNRLPSSALTPNAAGVLSILVAALAIGVPFAAVAFLAQGRPGWRGIGATATSLLISGGYVVLDAAVRVTVPQRAALIPLHRRYAAAGLRLAILMPYVLVAARLAPRLVGDSDSSVGRWLGLDRFRWPPFFLALAAGALVTAAWPITGALGDSLASLALSVQMLVRVLCQVLIFWGVIFYLLTRSFARTEAAAGTTILIYSLTALGGFLPDADSSVLVRAFLLLALGLLLTEMRVRGRSVFPLFPLAFCFLAVPALFIDPRDALANGIPELQHIASYVVAALAAAVSGGLLWLGRRVSERRRGERGGGRARRAVAALVAAAGWGLWMALYLFAGEPGFFNDGFLIVLEDQTDLTPATTISDREERLVTVYDALVETAGGSQSSIRAELNELGVPYRPYYIVNMVRVDGHRWLMGRFEGRPGVASVILNPNARKYPRRIELPYESADPETAGVQENLAAIGADVAWEAGVEGAGIVVGGQDTGYDWEHPALKEHYRGWDGESADHTYNWHDAWDGTQVPFDDGSHGTHTMGIVLGDDGDGNRIGVAPGARWMGCRNMRRGFGNPGAYAECMEFLLAPYPPGGDSFVDGDVGMAPDVVNNSWGCPWFEGCFPETLRDGIEALRAAGIIMVVSAGNDGPACGTAATPPANYDASFSVGAATDGGQVVGFSSRGPVDGLIKPDITAPGQRVASSVPGGGYAYASGTSMSAPHVAGAVALVWSADAALIGDVAGTEELLCRTATPKPVSRSCTTVSVPEGPLAAAQNPPACACGGVSGVPNNVYGCGIVDAGAAVTSALED